MSSPYFSDMDDEPFPLSEEESNVQESYLWPWSQLESALDALPTPGFATGGSLAYPPPQVRIHGADLSWPLSASDREALQALCTRSAHGQGSRTVFDPRVRSAWELTPDQFSVEGLEPLLREALASMEQALGEQHLVAELYKLQHYERGDHFREHRDSVKQDGMIGTLILGLPGDHEGGELRVELRGEDQRFRLNSTRECCSFIGFFADCLHELSAVRSGSRTCLVFSVKRGAPLGPRQDQEIPAALRHALDTWSKAPVPLAQCLVPLAHMYPGNVPDLYELRGMDRAVAEALQVVSHELGIRISLCSIRVIHELCDNQSLEWTLEYAREKEASRSLPLDSLLWPWTTLWIESRENSKFTGNEGDLQQFHYQHVALLLESPLPSFEKSDPPPLHKKSPPDLDAPQDARSLSLEDFFPETSEPYPEDFCLPTREPEERPEYEDDAPPWVSTEIFYFESKVLRSLLLRAHKYRWRRLDISKFTHPPHPSFHEELSRLESHLEELKTRPFGGLSCLDTFEKLHTLHLTGDHFHGLACLPEALLGRLRVLVLEEFYGGKNDRLDPLGKACRLEHLECRSTHIPALPDALSEAPLRVLRLSDCGLRSLPPGLGKSGHLEELEWEGCYRIKQIPPTALTPALRILNLWGTSVCDLDLTQATSLQRLNLHRYPHQKLPKCLEFCRKLEVLILEQAGLQKDSPVPDFRGLTSLRVLSLQGWKLPMLPRLPEPSRLEVLRCDNLSIDALSEEIGRMERLQELHASGCGLKSFPDLSALRRLRVLDLSNNPLRALEGLSGHKKLEELRLSGCSHLTLSGLAAPPGNLRSLHLENIDLGELPAWLTELPALEALSLDDTHLKAIPVAPGQWPALRTLTAAHNEIRDARLLGFLGSIELLDISHNPLEHLPSLANWPEMRELLLSHTLIKSLEIQPEFLKDLRKIGLENTSIETFPRLDLLHSLLDLSIDDRLRRDPFVWRIIERLQEKNSTFEVNREAEVSPF